MKLGMKFDKLRVLPLILTGIIVLADQITKALIAKYPIDSSDPIINVFNNDFLHIIHVRNPNIAFSIGRDLPDVVKPVLFVVLPLVVLALLVLYYFRSDDFTKLQRWAIAGILGGGIGNITDRIFRPDGVVDFISVRLPNFLEFLFGTNPRWPTFNIADSAVVVCCLLLFFSIIFSRKKTEVEVVPPDE